MSRCSKLHAIKRQARKEAWFSEPWNPFRKTNSSTAWATSDIEEVQEQDLINGVSSASLREVYGFKDQEMRNREVEVTTRLQLPHARANAGNNQQAQASVPKSSSNPTSVISTENNPDRKATTLLDEASKDATTGREQNTLSRFFGKSRRRGQNDEPTEADNDDAPKWKVRPDKKPSTVAHQIERTLLSSYINILLIAAPLGIALSYAEADKRVVFVINFIAVIPVAAILSYATEDVALHVGETLGGFLNAIYGNTVETVAIFLAFCTSNTVDIAVGSLSTFVVGGIITDRFERRSSGEAAIELNHEEAGFLLLVVLIVYVGYLACKLKVYDVSPGVEKERERLRPTKREFPQSRQNYKLLLACGVETAISNREPSTVQTQYNRRASDQLSSLLTTIGGLMFMSSFLVQGVSATSTSTPDIAGTATKAASGDGFWLMLLSILERVALDLAAPMILVAISLMVCLFCWATTSRWTVIGFWAGAGAIYTWNQKDTKALGVPSSQEDHPELLFGLWFCWFIFTGVAFLQAKAELDFGKIFTVITVLIGLLIEIIIHNSSLVSSVWEQSTGKEPTVDVAFLPSIFMSFILLEVYEYIRKKLYQPDDTLPTYIGEDRQPRDSQHRVARKAITPGWFVGTKKSIGRFFSRREKETNRNPSVEPPTTFGTFSTKGNSTATDVHPSS